MVDWENAAKAVEKVTTINDNNDHDHNHNDNDHQARPNREEAAKAACETAEAEFQACTQVAKGEVSSKQTNNGSLKSAHIFNCSQTWREKSI